MGKCYRGVFEVAERFLVSSQEEGAQLSVQRHESAMDDAQEIWGGGGDKKVDGNLPKGMGGGGRT